MRTKLHNFIVSPIVVLTAISISAILSYLTGGLGYVFGIVIALIALWASRFAWLEFGISRPEWSNTIFIAILYSLGIYFVMDILIQPFLELIFGPIDLGDLDGIRGNFLNYVIFIVFMWIVAGFGEELLYRGFFMKQLAHILGDSNKAWITAALIISSLFGLVHLYQGISGVITTGVIGFILSLIFYKNRTNLVLVMLTHGFYDVIGITLIHLNKERIIADWIQAQLM
jgi:CAAX protease family protein